MSEKEPPAGEREDRGQTLYVAALEVAIEDGMTLEEAYQAFKA